DAAHRPDNGAVAWIEDPDNGLFLEERTFDSVTGPKTRTFLKARAHFTPWGEQLVKDKIYRYFSSEIDPNYSTGEVETILVDGEEVETVLDFGPVLIGGGIVMRPYIPNLGEVELSDKPLEEIIKDEVSLFKSQDGDG